MSRAGSRLTAADLGLVGGVRSGPVDDLGRADHGPALVQRQHREVDLTGELLDLLAAAPAIAPGPRHQPVAGQVADLVLVAGLVECLGGASTRMSERAGRLLLTARVEDHGASLSRRAITSGTCSR